MQVRLTAARECCVVEQIGAPAGRGHIPRKSTTSQERRQERKCENLGSRKNGE